MPETTTHNGRAALVTEPKVKLRFYVPMGLPESNPVCDHVEAVLADEFGGYTETVEDAHGGWKHPDTGRIVEDEITLVESVVDPGEDTAEVAAELADHIKTELDQDSVMVEEIHTNVAFA